MLRQSRPPPRRPALQHPGWAELASGSRCGCKGLGQQASLGPGALPVVWGRLGSGKAGSPGTGSVTPMKGFGMSVPGGQRPASLCTSQLSLWLRCQARLVLQELSLQGRAGLRGAETRGESSPGVRRPASVLVDEARNSPHKGLWATGPCYQWPPCGSSPSESCSKVWINVTPIIQRVKPRPRSPGPPSWRIAAPAQKSCS